MNIIIPLGGKGIRFVNEGYTIPKPLINIFEKTMIEYVIDNIKHSFTLEDKLFIIYNNNLDNFNFIIGGSLEHLHNFFLIENVMNKN